MTQTIQGVDVADLVASLGAQHTLTVTNMSTVDGRNAVLYQDSATLPDGAVRLVWLARLCRPQATVALDWALNYSFVWGRQGNLHAGVDYGRGGILDARLARYNVARLAYDRDFAFRREPGPHPDGVLAVLQDGSVPGPGAYRRGCVGVGMDGAATFVAPTEPGRTLEFDPHPTYRLALARYAAGAVVDEDALVAPVSVTFPNGKTHAHATFDGDSWELDYR
ncbi:hypothetical protein [Actinokineospora enzanensis]|uniref:hypothetical protein n=1 Tax=Actinokineospora enzanensis TaxID=155975 RepID=UPI000363920C|nr:hypothetical protein [Actinokineospora enzanensis]